MLSDTRPTLEEIMEPWRFPLRKTDGAAAGNAVADVTHAHKLEELDGMLSALRGIVAMYAGVDRNLLDDVDKRVLRDAENAIESTIALRNRTEQSRAANAASDAAITKSVGDGTASDAVANYEIAKRAFDDAVAGRGGPFSRNEQTFMRQRLIAAEIALGEVGR